jgi:NAD(P)-dependent dehydrogenase (short-subunit alcohol dehydrogenase family)
MFSLKDKTAFISGGTSGIGLAVEAAAGAGAKFVHVDVSSEQSVADALQQAEQLVGRLDIVANNAGVGDLGHTFEVTPEALLEKVTRVNQWGVHYGLKYAPRHMNDGGSIINTSSLAASVSVMGAGVYSATKAAVLSMTCTAAIELGTRSIRVNAVCPAYIDTPMGGGEEALRMSESFTALGRIGQVEDVVGVFHFLAADESSYISGQAIRVDGGWLAGPAKKVLEQVLGHPRLFGVSE